MICRSKLIGKIDKNKGRDVFQILDATKEVRCSRKKVLRLISNTKVSTSYQLIMCLQHT